MALCPNCGEHNPDKAKFCSECATPLMTQPAPPQEARKTVTIVFCDLVGSTALGERLDSEALREVMDRYFTEMRAVLERHGGIVEKYIGDAVMAVFGLPRVHEDDALRAVRAASEMGTALSSLNTELERHWGVVLSNRTGVNTGEVVVGDASSAQRLATGDAVNVAARLEQAAAVGQVLIGASTHRLVKDAVRVESVDPLILKGKSEAMPAFRVIEVTRGRIPGVARRLDAPMVGREEELSTLLGAFEQTLADRTCHLVTVLGDGGVGKSRLVAEVVDRLRARARVLRSRCLSYGEGITFWPLAEIVKDAAAIGDEDSPAVARTKIESMLAGVEEATAISERLASVMILNSTSFPIEETFWATRKALEGLGRDQPLVVVLEDIHWAEATFLDLIEHVVAYSKDSSMLIVCPARRELLEGCPEWMQEEDKATSLSLEPLSTDESELLVDNLLGASGLNATALSRITGSAQGNPLFVEQIISMWMEDGTLRREDGRWRFAADASTTSIPPTISALLSARLDRLLQEERTVIAAASVVGQVFYQGAVQTLSPPSLAPQLPVTLADLTLKQFIRPEASSFAGQEGYAFLHVLIRDAAYEAMLKRTRAELHERFASWLERVAGERIAEYEEVLGYHFEQAYLYLKELGSVDEHGLLLATRSAELLGSAGRRAFLSSSLSSAVNLLGRSAALLPADDPERLELLLMLGTSLAQLGKLTSGEHVLTEVCERAGAMRNRRLEQYALMERAALRAWTTGENEDLAITLDVAIPVLKELRDDSGLARAFKWLAELQNSRGLEGSRVEALECGLIHARAAGDGAQEAEILGYLPFALVLSPMTVSEAIDRCGSYLKETKGTHRSVDAYHIAALGFLKGLQGHFTEGRALLAESRAIGEELGLPWMMARIAGLSGVLELLAGEPEAAEQELRFGCATFEKMGEKGRFSFLTTLLAESLYRQGRLEEAEFSARVASTTGSELEAQSVRAKILATKGSGAEAETLARQVVREYSEMQVPTDYSNALMDLAEVVCLDGRASDAVEFLEEALRLYEQKGNIVSATKARKLLEELTSTANGAPT